MAYNAGTAFLKVTPSFAGLHEKIRAAGAAILLISEDLDEVLALSDRVAVLFEGRVVGITDAADADVTTIGLQMTGGMASDPGAEPASPGGAA